MGKRKTSSKRRSRKYLGTVVPDIGKDGLDNVLEYAAIVGAILSDYKRKRIDENVARGRLLLLYNLARHDRDLTKSERKSITTYIRIAMRKLSKTEGRCRMPESKKSKSGYAKALSGLVFTEVIRTAQKASTVDDIVKRLVFRRKIVTGLGSKVPESVKKEALDVIDGTLKKLDPELYAKVRSGKFSIPNDRIPKHYRRLYEAVLHGRTNEIEKILKSKKRHRDTMTKSFLRHRSTIPYGAGSGFRSR